MRAPSYPEQNVPDARHPGAKRGTLNCLSIDVEEWFHCEVFADVIGPDNWAQQACRTRPQLERIGELLDRYNQRATFFVLGWMVPRMRPTLQALVDAGHELASHGYHHQHLRRMTPETLRDDLHRAAGVFEDAFGLTPRGYRAPTFSVTRETAWALDVIADAGFTYDASIFPIRHDRYGVPDAPPVPFRVTSCTGRHLLEFPPLTLSVGRWRFPLGGGGYLRLLPGAVLRRGVAWAQRAGRPVMLYLHPWELDPGQPTPRINWRRRWRHRVNLHKTEAKLERLLREFRFDTAANVLARVNAQDNLPAFRLGQQTDLTAANPLPGDALARP